MSRSGYSDDCCGWDLIRWRGAVTSALRGARGQAFLRELAAAMDAMPEKTLTYGELEADGEFCTLGVVGHARGLDMSKIDIEDREQVAKAFGIAEAMAAEVMFENDSRYDSWTYVDVEICGPVRPDHWADHYGRHKRHIRVDNPREGEARWQRMRAWVQSNIKETTNA